MNDTSTTPETALERAFALLKCSPIGDPKNSSEYGRAAYNLSEHCQGKEDVSEAAMRIFAHRIAELEQELEETQNKLKKTITELDLAGIEIFKWERDFTVLVNDFKAFANSIKKQ